MLPQATDEATDVTPVPPAPRSAPSSTENSSPVDPETLTFVDIEHVEVEQAELDAFAASWDGFL